MSSDGLFGRVQARMRREDGFTLVELLVVVLLGGILSAAIIGVLLSLSGVFNSQGVRIQNQDDARTAINQVSRYIRMATSSADNQTSQTNSVLTALPQDLEFYCDLDGDGVAEKARYYLSGTSLKMQTVEPTWVLTPSPHWTYPTYTTGGVVVQNAIRNGSSAVFRYYKNVSGTTTTSLEFPGLQEFTPSTAALKQQVVTIRISLTVNDQPALAKGNVQLATNVEIRQRYEGGLK
jgi:prepilin-type N-terminal cleavage/methylation domain-containing protein